MHDNGAADFTWVDLETLLVDKKLKLVCLLEHIVLRLSRRIKRAGSGLYCSVQDGRGGGWRAVSPPGLALHLAVLCTVHFVNGLT